MNHDTKKRLQYVVVAGTACLLTMAPAAMAQTGAGGASQAPSGTKTDTMNRGQGTTGEQDKSMGRHDQTMGERGSMGERGAKQGDASRIRRVQEALKAAGHDPGPIDGVMGPRTQEALREYQKQENINQTGRLDQETMSKLGV
jgi:peptidoglycan hydrolase-like protein with peptidoglycan-binding domain